jgi:hypothetical protein
VTTTPGTWAYAPTSFSYQWRRCSSAGTSCVAIAGATRSSYTPGNADIGHTLQCAVTARNSAGSTTAAAPPSFVVAAASLDSLGVWSVGGASGSFSADRKVANKISVRSTGRLLRLSAYLQHGRTSGSQNLMGVVYKDSNGRPGALVARTWQRTFSSSQAAGWYPFTFSSPVPVTFGSYWIGIIAAQSSGVTGFRWVSRAGARAQNYDVYRGGPSNPFGTASTDAELMSIYTTWAY